MKTITKADYERAAARYRYWRGRWPYLELAAQWVQEAGPARVLELGPHSLPIVRNGHTMERRTWGPNSPTYLHDATRLPWPVPDASYDLFIALQVWEHLAGFQAGAFAEVMRIARGAILSFPFGWHCPTDPTHHGIDGERIRRWTLAVAPAEIRHVGRRVLYRFDFTRANPQADASRPEGTTR